METNKINKTKERNEKNTGQEFWNSYLTEKSFEILQKFNKKYNFIVIGGWATYLLTKQQKSKDIDIIVDLKELQKLKQEKLIKNDRLKKYEIKIDEIDIDIYVSYFSELALPVNDLKKYSLKIQGFNVLSPEALLILKQGAEIDRRNSIKGEKDRIDILSLLFFSEIDFNKYKKILSFYKLDSYCDELINLVLEFQDYNVFTFTPNEFKLKKKELLSRLRKL
jgi:hypothetical protein